MCALLERYVAEHGNANVPYGLKYEGKNLGIWVATQRQRKKTGTISQEQITKLDALGFGWGGSNEEP